MLELHPHEFLQKTKGLLKVILMQFLWDINTLRMYMLIIYKKLSN